MCLESWQIVEWAVSQFQKRFYIILLLIALAGWHRRHRHCHSMLAHIRVCTVHVEGGFCFVCIRFAWCVLGHFMPKYVRILDESENHVYIHFQCRRTCTRFTSHSIHVAYVSHQRHHHCTDSKTRWFRCDWLRFFALLLLECCFVHSSPVHSPFFPILCAYFHSFVTHLTTRVSKSYFMDAHDLNGMFVIRFEISA